MPKKLTNYRVSLPKYPDPDATPLDKDILDSQFNENKAFDKADESWDLEDGEDYEEAYQMERDGESWGGGYEAGTNFMSRQ